MKALPQDRATAVHPLQLPNTGRGRHEEAMPMPGCRPQILSIQCRTTLQRSTPMRVPMPVLLSRKE